MDSLDAQCLLIQFAEGEIQAPQLWRHDRSGSLSCAYDGSERAFTWPAEQVAEMARRWRNSGTSGPPERARSFVDAHHRLEAIASEAGLGPADVITHDLGRAELRGTWENEKLVLVVEGIGKNSGKRPVGAPALALQPDQDLGGA